MPQRVGISWAQWLVIVTTGLPLVAAAAARRLSPRDPVGQVGLAWGAQFVVGLTSLAFVLTGRLPLLPYTSAASSVLLALLLVPPLLAWLGPWAKARQGPVLAGLAAWAAVALATVELQRAFTFAFKTPTKLALLALSVGVLAAQARLAGDPTRDAAAPGWLPIAGGHALYFLTGTLTGPLRELVLPRGLGVVREVATATMLLYASAMGAIAWGIWQTRAARRIVSAEMEVLATRG